MFAVLEKIATTIVSKVYDKLIISVESGIPLKTSPYLSLTTLSERQRELLWKNFIAKTEPIERQYIKELKKYFRKQADDISERMDEYDSGNRFLTLEDTEQWLFNPDDYNEKLTDLNIKFNLESIKTGGRFTDEALKDFDIADVAIRAYLLSKTETFAFAVNDYTTALLKNNFIIAIENQESIRDIAKRVESIFGFNEKYRSVRIARTEVIGASNFGSYQSSIQSDVVWGHVWLAALDERTRDSHRTLGSQQVKAKVGDRFPIVNLLWPGDQSGDPAEFINCRCALNPLTRKPAGVE